MQEKVSARIENGKITIEYHNRTTSIGAEFHHEAKFEMGVDGSNFKVITPYHNCGQWLMGNPDASRECTVCGNIFGKEVS